MLSKKDEKELMDLLGDIASGEFTNILIIGERATKAGEPMLVVRFGGVDEEGARGLAARGLWSDAMTKDGAPREKENKP